MSKARQLADLGNQIDDGAINGTNMIVNGAMTISQRGTSTSLTHQSAEFVTDRFQSYEGTAGGLDVEQSTTAPDGFYYSTKWTVTSADTSLASGEQAWVRQRIEGYNMAHLGWGTSAAQTVTLSFWVRSSVTGTFAGSFQNASGNRVYPYTYSILSADTWEHKEITVAGETTGTWGKDNSNGCTIYWSFGMATNLQGTAGAWASSSVRTASGETQLIASNGATFYLTGVCLNVGDSAIDFPHESYGDTLAKCQRYYFVNDPDDLGTYMAKGAYTGNQTTAIHVINFPTTMRASPTIGSYTLSQVSGVSTLSGVGFCRFTGSATASDSIAKITSPVAFDAEL
jgi:hypothetical protein